VHWDFCCLYLLIKRFATIIFRNKGIWLTIKIVSILSGIVVYSNFKYLTKTRRNSFKMEYFIKVSPIKVFYQPRFCGNCFNRILCCFILIRNLGLATEEGQKILNCCLIWSIKFYSNGKAASQWFVYGTLYTIAIVGLGYKFILNTIINKLVGSYHFSYVF
jgi:hypothetical protein